MNTEQIKLYCGFCGHQDIYTKRTAGEKDRVSSTISCKKCRRALNHKNTWK